MITIRDSILIERLRTAVSTLMSMRVDGERARLTVPVLYPSGNSCVVEVVANTDRCFVSDIGLGNMESEMFGAQDFYDHCARQASERFGVGYDGLSVFTSWASLDNIESAVVGVANASVQATTSAVMKAAEEKNKQNNSELFDRIRTIFGSGAVSKTAELKGRDAEWEAHNVVLLSDHRRAVFEFVNEHANSVSSKFMMFSDLSKRKDEYSLNSVVRSIDRIGTKGAMLSDVSNVIELSSPDADFVRYAKVS